MTLSGDSRIGIGSKLKICRVLLMWVRAPLSAPDKEGLMKTVMARNLVGAQLDWATAKCKGLEVSEVYGKGRHNDRGAVYVRFIPKASSVRYDPSVNWEYGGPIIEKEGVSVTRGNDILFTDGTREALWLASKQGLEDLGVSLRIHGTTPLEAAMRCYVISVLGDVVSVPKELC